jgi:alpha-L-fucosidase 2
MNFWARLHEGDHSYLLLEKILKESTNSNLWNSNPYFQIDGFIFIFIFLFLYFMLGNFGAANGIVEMLIQSQGDELVQVNLYFI